MIAFALSVAAIALAGFFYWIATRPPRPPVIAQCRVCRTTGATTCLPFCGSARFCHPCAMKALR